MANVYMCNITAWQAQKFKRKRKTMSEWKMLTLVGKDRSGIVAKITSALYEAGVSMGEASMMRLGGNFTIMLMVKSQQDIAELGDLIKPVVKQLNLTFHFQDIEADLFHREIPDTCVTVYGADRPGIVAKVTTALADAGFNIMELESDMAGSEHDSIYIMQIEGNATQGQDVIEAALKAVINDGIHVEVSTIDTMIG